MMSRHGAPSAAAGARAQGARPELMNALPVPTATRHRAVTGLAIRRARTSRFTVPSPPAATGTVSVQIPDQVSRLRGPRA
jgi:hypothetical protein